MSGLGFGRRKIINNIVLENWKIDSPERKIYTYNELLFVIQGLLEQEGKPYVELGTRIRGHMIFRNFVKHLMYRNIANYDSMILITSEKGCITGDALLEMPRDLKKYPKGIPLKELAGKGPIWVYCFNKKTKKLELKKSDGVEFVKNDDVYEVELTNGMKLKATGDHPFLLTNGEYKQLKDLYWIANKRENGTYEHSRSMINSKLIYTDRLRIISRPNVLNLNNNRIKIDYSDIKRNEGDTTFKHSVLEHHFILNQLGYITKNKIIHHKNNKHWDNNVNNLELLESHSAHYIKHNMGRFKFSKGNKFGELGTGYSTKKKEKIKIYTDNFKIKCREKRLIFCNNNCVKLSKIAKEREKNNINSNHIRYGGIIKSIKYLGKQDVFDVVNVRDNHNFIVNGFVVSNTGKSSAAIMLAREWARLLGIKFNPARHIAYNNADVMNKIDSLNRFEPLICDESIRFASAADWNLKANKELKKKLAQVRTKHLLYILCFPLKIYKLEKTYLESYTNYWVDLFARGRGAIYVKDRNPTMDTWRMNLFKNVGSYTEFTSTQQVQEKLKKHPNFWQIISFPKPPEWLYSRYLKVREKNVYDDENVMASVSKQDIHTSLLILALRDIMMNDTTLTMNRIILHVRNQYDLNITKGMVQNAIDDAKQLIDKIKEEAMEQL